MFDKLGILPPYDIHLPEQNMKQFKEGMMKIKKFLLLSLAVTRQQFNTSAATGCVHDPGHNKLLNLALIPFPICKVGTTLCQTFFFSLFLTINLVLFI